MSFPPRRMPSWVIRGSEKGFNDSAWKHAADPQSAWAIGYARGSRVVPVIGPLLQTDVLDDMLRKNSSIWVRQTFPRNDFPWISRLALRLRYDDGFVAYLNGKKVGQANAPSLLQWDSAATDLRANEEVIGDVLELTIADGESLIDGTNVLAIQGLNSSARGADLLIEAQLVATSRATLLEDVPVGHFVLGEATPGAANGAVTFSSLASVPNFSMERDLYDEPFELVISADTPGATLAVTTDGSWPSRENGTLAMPASADTTASMTIPIDRTSTVRAAALKEGLLPSQVATHTYLFLDDIVNQDFEATIAAGFPPSWDTTAPDYGLDSDVIGPNDLFEGRVQQPNPRFLGCRA